MKHLFLIILILATSKYSLSQNNKTIRAKEASVKALTVKYGFEQKNQGKLFIEDRSITTSRGIKFKLNSSSLNNSNSYNDNEFIDLYFGKENPTKGYVILSLKDLDGNSSTKTIIKGEIFIYLENGKVIKCMDRTGTLSYYDKTCLKRFHLNKEELLLLNKYDIESMMFNLVEDSNGIGIHNERRITSKIDDISIQEMCRDCEFGDVDPNQIKRGETNITFSALYPEL